MSPEILNEAGHEMSSDWWALGIVLYELATGHLPFRSLDIDEIAEEIKYEDLPMKDYFSNDLRNLIEGLTNKDPKLRLGHPSRGGAAQIK